MIVIDASVAVKWYFPESGSDEAIRILANCSGEILVPELFVVEVCAALVRHANTNKSQRSGVLSLLTEFALTIDRREFEVHAPSLTLPFKAATLAIDLGHPLKDCIYLALAMEQACLLVTADARFAAKAETVFQNIGLLDDF